MTMLLRTLYVFGAISITTVLECKQNSNIAIEVIQDGPIQIIGVNDILNCNGIICPEESIFCYVQIDAIGRLDCIRRIRVCMDLNGNVTKLHSDVRTNPLPGEPYHYSSANYDIE